MFGNAKIVSARLVYARQGNDKPQRQGQAKLGKARQG
jgi:hypothetical protein